MSELDIAERRVPQDGRFRMRIRGRKIDFRVSIMPAIHGENCVIRILDKEQINESFRELNLDVVGFAPQDLKKFRKFIAEPYGMVAGDGADGLRQDDHALRRAQRDQERRGQDHHHRGPGRVPAPGHHPDSGQREEGAHLRARAAQHPAPRPRQDNGRRDPRLRDGADRHPVGAHRPPGLHDRPREQRHRRDRPLPEHGRRALQLRLVAQLRAGPAARAHALPATASGSTSRRTRSWSSRG